MRSMHLAVLVVTALLATALGASAEQEKPKKVKPVRVNGEISALAEGSVTVSGKKKGEAFEATATLAESTEVYLMTNDYEEFEKNGETRKKRIIKEGSLADLAVGQKVQLFHVDGTATKIVVAAPKVEKQKKEKKEKKEKEDAGEDMM